MITFGDLFAGIGGISLGLERAGMRCSWQVEKDEFCTKVLAKYWPNVARYGDVHAVGASTLAPVNVLAGGFPCQPHSLAGERKASQDERNLWPEFYRIICELRPQWVLAENVLGLLSSEDGNFFSGVLRDLAEAGYDAEWTCLRASDVGAPHQRERVFIVAHTASARCQEQQGAGWIHNRFNAPGQSIMAYTDNERCQECDIATVSTGTRRHGRNVETFRPSGEPQSIMGRSFNGLSVGMDRHRWPGGPGEEQRDWEPSRVTTERLPHRRARLTALGNAVVPQLAEYIGRRIMEVANV